MPAKEIKELRQSGRLEEALEMAQNELNAQPDNIWGKRNISWVYYEYLKKHAHEFDYESFIENLIKLKELNLPKDEVMVFDTSAWQIARAIFSLQKSEPVDYSKINTIFDLIKDFHFTKPSESYSLLYKAFHKSYKSRNGYLPFSEWWNFENFRPEDYKKEEYNGRQIMALVEQAYIAYAKNLLAFDPMQEEYQEIKEFTHQKIKAFIPKLDKLIESHPQYQYLPYFKAKLLLEIGTDGNVLAAFLPFAKQKRNDFWVWELISDIFPVNDERKTACLCKALSLKSPEDFLIKTRQKLAELLIEKELFDEAKTEINKIVMTRESHNWRIPQNILRWTNEPWFASANEKSSNRDFYAKYILKAEELLFQDIAEDMVAVEFVNKDKKVLNFVKDKNLHGFFSYKGFNIKPQIGDVYKVRLKPKGNEGFFQVFTLKPQKELDVNDFQAIKEIEGKVRISEGQNFAFIEDVYISPEFVKKNKLKDQDEIACKVIKSYNKKKEAWGWKVYSIYS